MKRYYPYLYNHNDFLTKVHSQSNQQQYIRIILLNWQEQPIKEIEGNITSGSLTKDGASSVRASCSLTAVFDYNKYDVNDLRMDYSINKKVFIEIGLQNNTDEFTNYDVIWFPQGIFYIADISISSSTSNTDISITLKDKMAGLNGEHGGTFPSTVVLDSKEDIVTMTTGASYTTKKITIYELIQELVHHWGNEPLSNIIIEDIPLKIPSIVRWNGDTSCFIKYYVDDDGVFSYDFQPNRNNLSDEEIKDYAEYKSGQDIGYEYVDFIYQDDLTMSAGSTVTDALDKIKTYLGKNYEYYYDIDGSFHFREIKNYINTTYPTAILKDSTVKDYLYTMACGKTQYKFSDDSNLISVNVSPRYGNIKNDFVVQGMRKSKNSEISSPIMYHLAVDTKPDRMNEYINCINYILPNEDQLNKMAFPVTVDCLPEVGTYDTIYISSPKIDFLYKDEYDYFVQDQCTLIYIPYYLVDISQDYQNKTSADITAPIEDLQKQFLVFNESITIDDDNVINTNYLYKDDRYLYYYIEHDDYILINPFDHIDIVQKDISQQNLFVVKTFTPNTVNGQYIYNQKTGQYDLYDNNTDYGNDFQRGDLEFSQYLSPLTDLDKSKHFYFQVSTGSWIKKILVSDSRYNDYLIYVKGYAKNDLRDVSVNNELYVDGQLYQPRGNTNLTKTLIDPDKYMQIFNELEYYCLYYNQDWVYIGIVGQGQIDSKYIEYNTTTGNIYQPTDWRTELYMQALLSQKNGLSDIYISSLNATKVLSFNNTVEWHDAIGDAHMYYHHDYTNYSAELIAFWYRMYDIRHNCFYGELEETTSNDKIWDGIYYLDFIEPTSSAYGEYSIDNIGKRTNVTVNEKINYLFEPNNIPDIFFINAGTPDDPDYINTDPANFTNPDILDQISYCEMNNKQYISLSYDTFMKLSSGGIINSAYEQIKADLYEYTNYQKTLSLTTLPVFHLSPNSLIFIDNSSTQTYGNYLATQFTIPFGDNNMTINCSEVIAKL